MPKGLLVGFIGAPISGKTTTAFRLFATLKNFGIPGEFVTEQARIMIARAKEFSGQVKLDDGFQFQICAEQNKAEQLMVKSCLNGLVVTDSSSLNSYLYLSEAAKTTAIDTVFSGLAQNYDLLFYCPPVPAFVIKDPNRVHSREESLAIDAQVPGMIEKFGIKGKMVVLVGDSDYRLSEALRATLELYKQEPCR